MCGIAGIIDYNGKENSRSAIEEMLRAINYRGPDESGYYRSAHSAIGNVRLSIIDISGGQQPLSDPTGRYWIVFNGEIFNYPELRDLLKSKGHQFSTQSDTEVLVQLYAVYGRKCLSMLNGQFAFAIWDKNEEELFLARDRIGIRPLFYNFSDGIFTFASEIKSIFRNKRIRPVLNNKNIAQIYTFWTAITPNTAFTNVFELSPGHFMVCNRKGIEIVQYWSLEFNRSNHYLKLPQAAGMLDELLADAVRIRLRADVEVAAYLSGGIDSSATVSYIKNIEPGVLNTFSIGFSEKAFDESSYQNEAVAHFKTNHKSIKCTAREIADSFPRVVWHSETPVTRTAPAPMFLLSRLVRENNIKVVITGEGADELMAGYDIFKEAKIRHFWAKYPNSTLRPLLLKKLYPYLPQMKQANPAILKMFYGFRLEDISDPFYSHLLRWNNSNHIKKHLATGIKEELNGYSPLNDLEEKLPGGFGKWDYLEKSQWLETTVFMSGYLLSSQGDRMAMANSVEGRYPFLDYRVIEFCSSLPSDFKLNGLNEKFILKKMMNDRIPQSILRRSKQAYRAPIKNAFVQNDAPGYVRELLSPGFFSKAGIFDYSSFSRLLSKIETTGVSTEMDDMVLSSVISTHLIYNQFIEGNTEGLPTGTLANTKIIEDI